MSKNTFTTLIEDFCKLSGLDKPHLIVQGGPVMVNEIVFSLIHSDKVDDDLIFLYADFGALPTGRESDACIALLEANLFLYNGKGPTFTVSPETKRVIFADHRIIAKITAKDLSDLLVNLSAKAKEWRDNYFLDNKPQKPRTQRPLPRGFNTPK